MASAPDRRVAMVTGASRGIGKAAALALGGAPPEVIGAAIVWIATSLEANRFLGKTVHAQKLVGDRGLLPGWPPPQGV